jgi:hypothetical protein
MFKKYETLSEAYKAMVRLADEFYCKMMEAETAEEVMIHNECYEAFMKAATTIEELVMKAQQEL